MTLRYVFDHADVVSRFVAQLIPHVRVSFSSPHSAIGIIDEEGKLIAGLVYHNYSRDAETIEISGAALPGVQWLTRQTIAHFYGYPFLQLGCQMIYQRTPADDERLLGMLAAYNYHFIKIPRAFGRHRDGVLCCLTYEAWASNRFNKRLKHHLHNPFLQHEEAA
jgi:hypothetical protein